MEDIPNTTAGLRSRFEQFQKNYTGNIRLHLAAEYMLDNLFKERLAHRDLLPIGEEGNHLLVETSYFNPPMDLYGMMEKSSRQDLFQYWHIRNVIPIWGKKIIIG